MLVVLDLLLGSGYSFLGLLIVTAQVGPSVVAQTSVMLAALAVTVCRRWVLLGYGAALAAQLIALVRVVSAAGGDTFWVAVLTTPAMAYALFRISAGYQLRWAIVGWLPALAFPVAVLVQDDSVGPVFPIPLVLLPSLLIGYVERRRHQEMVRHHEELAGLERDRSRLAIAEERMRIVRELHDVVSHGMSVIAVQAGSGRLVIDERPQEAATALDAIETTSRQMLGEMRQMLAVLRADDGAPPMEPAPGLADLEALIAQMSRAGVHAGLTVSGQPVALPPGIDLAAYRIIQEALTNVARHAWTDTCQVRIAYGSEAVSVEICDEGRGSPAGCTGLGLTGMRERAQLCGGRLEAHPLPGRGFRVAAWLPLPTAAPTRRVSWTVGSAPAERAEVSARVRTEERATATTTRRRRGRVLAFQALAIGSSTVLLLALTGASWISYSVKEECQEAKSAYAGDCVEALVSLLGDENRSFRSRNDAIWALGRLRDRRALPALQRYRTGYLPRHEPVDRTISQYELEKAIRLVTG